MRTEKEPSAFRDADVLVVVDDWKANTGKFERAPTYYAGRSFASGDPFASRVAALLASVGAANWHAGGKRATHGFLFDSPAFGEVLEFLNAGTTCLYDMLASVDAFETPELKVEWRRILDRHPELRPVWDVESPFAKSLFRFADLLARRLVAQVAPGLAVRIVVDCLDWTTSRTAAFPIVSDGVVRLAWGERGAQVELVSIVDKQASGAAAYLPLLGLVDSEVWAFGRLNSLVLSDGRPVRDWYLDWQARGSPDGDVVPEEEFSRAMGAHAAHEQLRAYWDALRSWGRERRTTLKAWAATTAGYHRVATDETSLALGFAAER